MANDFDDIKSLLDDVLNDKPVTTPEEVEPTPEVIAESVAAVTPVTPPADEDILGDFLADMKEDVLASPEALSPATHSAEDIEAAPNLADVEDVESVLAEIGVEPLELQRVVSSEGLTTEQIDTGLALEKALDDPAELTDEEETEVIEEQDAIAISEHVFADSVEKDVIPLPTFTTDDIAEELDIRNFATLVTLNTARWHAKVKDRTAAKAAADAAGATPEAFEARKLLLAGCDAGLKAVHKEIDNARTEHYRLTMPWSSVGVNDVGKRSGGRLMPNTLFLDYTSAMAQAKANMQVKLDIFVKQYPSLLTTVQQKLGTAFDPAQYPNPSSIAAHFNLSFDFNPIPVGSDFKGLQQAQTEKLSAALNRKTRAMLENAMQDAWKTLYDSVAHAAAVLADPGKMFHKTLIEKLVKQGELLSHLNATKDAGIEEIRVALAGSALTKHDPKDIRKDEALRKRLSEEAKGIVERMEELADA